ncbi:MAG: CarD family transcriptional regulator [Lachnospiraceae bacterium]|jgi:CarD family transcriptional regulator|nr:CarD family transcriptional regulator [Lachnospiraceae bacterium]MEE3461244.1 CarD family transcriptional regulator [Lachnospiraceae bacterium]
MVGKIEIKRRAPRVKPEYDVGELVVYGSSGVCRIDNITRMTTPGSEEKADYYCLVPVDNQSSRIYVMVGQKKVNMRRIISRPEAVRLIDSFPDLKELVIESDKLRAERYKEALQSCDAKEWLRIIKTLRNRNKKRLSEGRKITSTDERYMKEVKRNLYTELSIVFKKDRDQIEDFIIEKCTQKEPAKDK